MQGTRAERVSSERTRASESIVQEQDLIPLFCVCVCVARWATRSAPPQVPLRTLAAPDHPTLTTLLDPHLI